MSINLSDLVRKSLHKPSTRALLACACMMLMCLPGTALTGGKDKYADGRIDVWMVDVDGYDTPKAVVKAMINAPPEKVWPLIDKCAKYDKTMLRIANSRLIKKTGHTHICEIEVDMPFPMDNLVAVTKAKHKAGPDKWSRKWKLVRGDYTVNTGSWVLTPYDEAGTKTMVHYQLLAEPTSSIPDWVRDKAQRSALPKLIEHIRDQVE